MKDHTLSKVSFWAYDIFGYLLPGTILLAAFAKSNSYVYDIIETHWDSTNYLDIVIVIAIAYTLGHVVSALSSYILERAILRKLIGYPTTQMFDTPKNKKSLLRIITPGYLRAYSQQFQDRFKELFDRRFGLVNYDEHDYFWLCWSYISYNHPVAYRRATHFLELYGFTRNMSMTFLLISTATIYPGWTAFINPCIYSIIFLFAGIILFSNYVKLLRRLNDEVYRAFVAYESETHTVS